MGLTNQVRAYQSVSHALLEIGMALQMMYSHKKQYYTGLKSLGNHYEDLSVFLSRQGIKAIPLDGHTQEVDEKKTLFSIIDVDDAITGEKYIAPTSQSSDSKILQISIYHHLHLVTFPEKNIGETDIYVLSHPAGGAVVLFGKRAQNISSFICSTLQWQNFSHLKSFPVRVENKNWVEQVEKQSWQGSQPLLVNITERIYDRAIISWIDKDAGAIRDILINDHKVVPEYLESLSLYRWMDMRLLTQFEKRGWSAEQMRGTLILSTELVSDKEFFDKLHKSIDTVIALSEAK